MGEPVANVANAIGTLLTTSQDMSCLMMSRRKRSRAAMV
jgi:hypothetical protein